MLQQSPDVLFVNHKTLLNVPAQQLDKSEFKQTRVFLHSAAIIRKTEGNMKIYGKKYKEYAEGRAQKSPIVKDCICAFVIGGGICVLAQVLKDLYEKLLSAKEAGTLTSVTLIFLTALLTGLGLFDKIAKRAGAGTLVPITGFANAVSSCAVDAKGEGFILGVGAKLFAVAGPVILYGTAAGAVYGVIYWITTII